MPAPCDHAPAPQPALGSASQSARHQTGASGAGSGNRPSAAQRHGPTGCLRPGKNVICAKNGQEGLSIFNSLNKKMKLYDKLVVSIENLIFEKYKFVSKLKPYQVEIFELLEKYWGLDKDYDTLKQTMEICQTSLNRKMNIERNQIQEKQSNILFFLAVLQIFSLISVSVDFFNLPELKTATELKIYHNFFKENILNILIILSSILIIFAYYKPFRFKVKEWFSK